MIDIKEIRKQPELYRDAARRKRIDLDLDLLLELDKQCRALQTEVETQRAERNKLSEMTKTIATAEKERHLEKAKTLTQDLDQNVEKLRAAQLQLDDLLLRVPSIPSNDTPDGADDTENVEVRRWGNPTEFNDFQPLDHIALTQLHKMANFEDVRTFAGSRAYALTGMGALLEIALMRFAIDHLIAKGFTLVVPPLLVRDTAMTGTGYFPIGAENAYAVERDKAYLVGTAEVPVVAMHAEKTYKQEELPLRLAGVSTCFRREAGAAGKDTRGLYRVHQFQKVEQVVITTNDVEQTQRIHQEILQNAEELLQALELPYRVVAVCTGDLGLGQVRKHDIETWMPSRNAYGETHSCSTLNDFQARRLAIKFADANGKKQFAHTLNNTAIASPRILIPLLENHQRADRTIYVPPALRPYLGGRDVLAPT